MSIEEDGELFDLCDHLDAAIFVGCKFSDAENRKGLRSYMARWERELKALGKVDEEGSEDDK